MAANPEQAGDHSQIFGDRFPYPFDGKTVLFEIANQFAREFNTEAKAQLLTMYGAERAATFQSLTVTSAYPTIRQQCPRIAIQRMNYQPAPMGLGGEYNESKVEIGSTGQVKIRKWLGQTITEQLEVGICTLNETLRDDLFLWFQQYVLDASFWMVPQLKAVGFYELQCTGAVDDQVEYQGTQSQPGFEFYIARINYRATFDMSVFVDVDQLKTVINWEKISNAPGLYQGIAGDVDAYQNTETLSPPDETFNHDSTANSAENL